ncbi:MAG: hypothetical protein IT323_00550 [Anaerolineae bacterium]|nr:hypothetical protein [Anaerolineae bacterium]
MPARRLPVLPSATPNDEDRAITPAPPSRWVVQPRAKDAAPQENDASVETLSPTARIEWLCDRRIVCYWASGAARETYRLLFDRAEDIARAWPDGAPYLLIIDFLTGEAGVTPYAKERGRTLNKLRPDLPTMMSMLMPRSVVASFAQLAMRAFQNPVRAIAIHHSREDGVEWLRKMAHLE